MNRLHSFFRTLLIVYVCLLIAGAGVVVGALKLGHIRLLGVQTGSMTPILDPGDAVLVSPARGALQAGEVVSFVSPLSGHVVSHRIVSIDSRLGQVTTRGDNAGKPDTPISQSAVIGRVAFVLPALGSVINFLRRPIGLALFLYLPALVVVVGEIKRLAKHYGRGYYRLYHAG